MSLVDDILNGLYQGKYRNYRFLFDLVYKKDENGNLKIKENTFRSTLSRLGKKGLVQNKYGAWKITEDGLEFLNSKNKKIKEFFYEKPRNKNIVRNLIVCFDIPEKERRSRDWLRSELIGFGFEPIQKSLWFGPPLPKEFVEFLSERKILDYIRFFKAEREDVE